MQRKWVWGLVSLLIIAQLVGGSTASAQSSTSLYFPETGHWVSEKFLETYLSIPNRTELFGLPITEPITIPGSKQQVQYFERARFVLDYDNNGTAHIKLTPLGSLLYKPGIPLTHSTSLPACRKFPPEKRYMVCYAFLDYFFKNGGVAQFGLPISNLEVQNNVIVQYFQLARFEWHPENQINNRVMLGNLGSEAFQYFKEDPSYLAPVINHAAPGKAIMFLRVDAFVGEAVMPRNGKQTLFVTVRSQTLFPVADATVKITVLTPDGKVAEHLLSPTNALGITSASFPIESQTIGIAQIRVAVSYGSLQQETRTSFHIWW